LILLTRTKYSVKICESWFADEELHGPYDVVFYRQSAKPFGKRVQEFCTPHINLQCEESLLWERITKNCRYEIRWAQTKDGIECYLLDIKKPDEMIEFCSVYNRFAETKGLGNVNEAFLSAVNDQGSLCITFAAKDSDRIVYHVYIRDMKRVRLLHSCSLFRISEDSGYRNMTARTNRFLHWWDILYFRESGVKIYDMGGWYTGDNDDEKKKVNDFKANFGADIKTEYHSSVGLTLKGKLALMWLKTSR
jgi:hypothetical protein